MSVPLIELADYTPFTGETLTEEEQEQVRAIIRVASALLRAKVPGLDDRILTNTIDRDLVVGVMVEAVANAFDTMRVGLRVKSTRFPEWETEYNTSTSLSGLVSFTPEQIGLLTPTVESNAFSIRLSL
jgi:hypothetical protein